MKQQFKKYIKRDVLHEIFCASRLYKQPLNYLHVGRIFNQFPEALPFEVVIWQNNIDKLFRCQPFHQVNRIFW